MPLPKLPEGPLRLENLRVPGSCLNGETDLTKATICIADGIIVDDHPMAISIDMGGAIAFPAFIDMHTHLDKGHIWPRTANPDGSFEGALSAVRQDTQTSWTANDVRTRMSFALRCAYAHGTRAIRTHIDSQAPQDAVSWGVFQDVREEWSDKIALQAACLVGCDYTVTSEFETTSDIVKNARGVLGMVTYPNIDLQIQLDAFFQSAIDRDLDVDFHVDETLDPSVNTLKDIAETVIRTSFDGKVTVGHLCSLSTMDESEALRTLDIVARAGLHVVSLPMCNMYLQDRHASRTPRNRGITLVHEMAARGVSVSFASDNTRDPFYAYGDLDMIEVMREATRIGHLDHSDTDWSRAFLHNPAEACGFDAPSLLPSVAADMVLCNARNWTELFARPQSDRIVLRNGKQIDRTLPDYAELDSILEPT